MEKGNSIVYGGSTCFDATGIISLCCKWIGAKQESSDTGGRTRALKK